MQEPKKRFNRIYIEITNICNLNCYFCKKNTRLPKEMSAALFKKVLEEIKDYTNIICLHVKGEPLLHSHFDEILTLCDNYNLNISLTTNGILLKSKISELVKHKSLSKIHISLNAEVNNLNYLDDIFNSVSLFPQDKIIVYRLWTQKSNNLDQKSTKIVEKLRKYYNLSEEIVENIKFKKNTKIDINKYVDKGLLFDWPVLNNNKTNNFYEGLNSQLAILSNGIVTPCCLDDDGIINLGNIFKESLDTILAKEKTRKIIKGFRDNKCVELLCQSCTYKNRFK